MITGFVRGQDFRLAQTIVAAEEGYATARFVFQTGEWLADGVTVYAHFKRDSDGGQTDAAVVDGAIPKAAELTLDAGGWTVWLTGHRYEDGALVQRLTTDTEALTVKPAGFTAAEPLPVRSFGESILGVVQNIYRDVSDELQAAATATDEQLAEQDGRVSAQLETHNETVAAQLSTQNEAVAAQLNAQNEAVAAQLRQNASDVSTLLDANEADVDARLDENESAVARMLGAVKNRRDDSFIQFWAGSESEYAEAEKSGDTIYLIDLLGGGGNG